MGWGDSDTHYAFAMSFGKDLIILHDINQPQLIKYRFSHHGPGNVDSDENAFVGAFVGDNHFQIITPQ